MSIEQTDAIVKRVHSCEFMTLGAYSRCCSFLCFIDRGMTEEKEMKHPTKATEPVRGGAGMPAKAPCPYVCSLNHHALLPLFVKLLAWDVMKVGI